MISVVTAYYNRKKLFIRTLKSMMPYYGKIDFEVVVVDDGSDEAERLEDLNSKFPFLRIIRLEKENKWYKNACIPFNIGFAAIKGDKVIIQNPECYHFDPILEYVDKNLKSNDYLSFGCFSLDKQNTDNDSLFYNKTNIKNIVANNNTAINTEGELGWYNHSKFRPEAFHFCAALKIEDLYDLGGFDERFALGVAYDDDELIWRIKAKQMNIKFIDDYLVLHQNHYVKPINKSEADNNRIEAYKRNKNIFEQITKQTNAWKANCLENEYYNKKTENKIYYNYILEFNKIVNELVKYKISRKIGLYFIKVLSKTKL